MIKLLLLLLLVLLLLFTSESIGIMLGFGDS